MKKKEKEYKRLSEIWLKTAKDDLLWAKDSLKDKWYSRVCFISQQAVEKALKSYLFFQQEKLIRTHNLLLLLKNCQKYNRSFTKLVDSCTILNGYYIDTRCPDIWDITRFEDPALAKEALSLAHEVVIFVQKKIKA